MASGWGKPVARGTNWVIRRLELLALPPLLPPQAPREKDDRITMANNTARKTVNHGVLRASRLVNTLRCWEGGVPGKGREAVNPSHLPCPMHLFDSS